MKSKLIRIIIASVFTFTLMANLVFSGQVLNGNVSLQNLTVMNNAIAEGFSDECTFAWQSYYCYDGFVDGVKRCLHCSDPEYDGDCLSSK